MKCPHCNETLAITDRQGIEIDYCPKCRGIWLDRGELDKLLQGAGQHERKYKDYNEHYKHKKKESWLGEIFDF